MLNKIAILCLAILSAAPAAAQMNFGMREGNVSIGINLSLFPELEPVPGYPVYYAPRLNSNYFFYDGMYWVYQGDNWYSSSWYNGPWWWVAPENVPLYLLRVPVRYYRQPPPYFQGWQMSSPPRWDMHWGNDWARRRQGWDHWNHAAAPTPAPLPLYQRQYSGPRYPDVAQQRSLQSQNYRYQPHEPVPQSARPQGVGAPAPQIIQGGAPVRAPERRGDQRGNPPAWNQERAPTAPQARPPQPEHAPAAPQARPPQPERDRAGREAAKPAAQQHRQPEPVNPSARAQQNPATSQHLQPHQGGNGTAPTPERHGGSPAPQENRQQRRPNPQEAGGQAKAAPRQEEHRQGSGPENGEEHDHKR